MNKEVVISAYNRDYNWINRLDKNIKITIYRKGDNPLLQNEIKIENNIGRDVHTFFYHLYHQYDNLSDITFFSQDYHLDHVKNYVDIINFNNINFLDECALEYEKQNCWFFNTQYDILNCNNNGSPHDSGLDLSSVWCTLFNNEPPKTFSFTPAGHFGITKEWARKIPKNFYKKIIEILENRKRGPWEIERLEPYFFIKNINNIKIDNI